MASVATPVPEQKTTREPKNSKFTQQDLPALKPLLTPVWVAAVFFGIAIVFIPIGAACLAASAGLEGVGTTCNVTLTAPRHMKPPIYLYYELDNYYQNHRRYVKSRSDSQLRGTGDNLSSTSDCDPEQVLQADTSKLIMPCGLIAWSYFNDTYAVTADIGGTATAVAVDETGIAWESDIKHKFGSQAAQYFNLQEYAAYRGGNTITGALNADEHFIVWMRTAAQSNFRKLWGHIDTDLPKGTAVTVAITNRYNTYRFDGKKKVVLSTTSWLGGRNDFLGIAYVVVGGISFLCGCMFFIVQWRFPRQRGDVSYLSWNARALANTDLH